MCNNQTLLQCKWTPGKQASILEEFNLHLYSMTQQEEYCVIVYRESYRGLLL